MNGQSLDGGAGGGRKFAADLGGENRLNLETVRGLVRSCPAKGNVLAFPLGGEIGDKAG